MIQPAWTWLSATMQAAASDRADPGLAGRKMLQSREGPPKSRTRQPVRRRPTEGRVMMRSARHAEERIVSGQGEQPCQRPAARITPTTAAQTPVPPTVGSSSTRIEGSVGYGRRQRQPPHLAPESEMWCRSRSTVPLCPPQQLLHTCHYRQGRGSTAVNGRPSRTVRSWMRVPAGSAAPHRSGRPTPEPATSPGSPSPSNFESGSDPDVSARRFLCSSCDQREGEGRMADLCRLDDDFAASNDHIARITHQVGRSLGASALREADVRVGQSDAPSHHCGVPGSREDTSRCFQPWWAPREVGAA
jgi:hypothetical protein